MSDRPKSTTWENWRRVLLPLLVVAATARLALFLQLDADPLQDVPRSDAEIYHQWAETWVRGETVEEGAPFWRSPGYPALLSVVMRLVGSDPRSIVVFQQMLGLLTTLLVASFVLRRFGASAAWAAGLAMTLHGPFLFFETQILPASVAGLLFTGGILLFVAGLERWSSDQSDGKAHLRFGGSGALLSLATVFRPNLGLALPLAFLALVARFFSKRRNSSLPPSLVPLVFFLVFGSAPLLSTAGWNLVRSGEFVLTGANGGMNLYFAYHDDAGATFRVPESIWSDPLEQRDLALEIARLENGGEVSVSEASNLFGRRARRWIREHPGRAAELTFRKLRGFLAPADLSILASPVVSAKNLTILRWLAIPFTALAALGLAGAFLGGAALRHGLIVAITTVVLAAMIFFTYTRFRIVLTPLLAVGFGGMIGRLVRERQRLRSWVLPITAALVVVLLGVGGADLLESRRSLGVAWWALGNASRERWVRSQELGEPSDELLDRAEEAYKESVRIDPDSPLSVWALARLEQDCRRDRRRSREIIESLVERFPSYALGLLDLAVAERRGFGGKPPDVVRALDLFERAIRSGPITQAVYLLEWHEALWSLGRRDLAREKIELVIEGGSDAERKVAQRILAKRYP